MKSVLLVIALIAAFPGWGLSRAYALDLMAGRAAPPVIDGRIDFGEWPITANSVEFDHGFIAAVNDRMRLYLLVDVLDDHIDDPRSSTSEGDWIEVVVDVDEDGEISPGVDLIYTLWPSSRELRIQRYFSSSGVRMPLWDVPNYSSVAAGFGCFAADDTEVLRDPPLASECFNHRVWEIAIDLNEIGANPNVFLPTEYVLLYVRVHSNLPIFQEVFPEGGFDDMLDIQLVTVPAVANTRGAEIQFDEEYADDNGDGIVNDPLEVTQAVQHRDNSLRLVAHKDTAVRVYVEVREDDSPQMVTVSLYGTRDGKDLPGSPLSVEFWAWPDFEFPLRFFTDPFSDVFRYGIRKGRDNLLHTANFALPAEWVKPDNVFFHAKARYSDQEIESRAVEVFFVPRRTPYYVMIPINEGSWEAPVQVDETHLAAAESFLKTIYPVPDVNFERWEYPPFDIAPGVVTGEILRNDILENLIMYYDLLTALDVDPMPEQIFGYAVTADLGQAATRGPLCTTPGCGHVAGGGTFVEASSGAYLYNPTVPAHEINHNIGDPETWARHVPGGGVGEGTVDPEWIRLYDESEGGVEDPYAEFFVREFGFDTRTPWVNGYDILDLGFYEGRFTVVPPYWPEVMSYVTAIQHDGEDLRYVHPQTWTSPYRWERMFDFFEPEPSDFPEMRRRRMSFHVSGRMDRQGLVHLNPVFSLPGVPRIEPDSQGRYVLEVRYKNKENLIVPFTPTFTDSEGLPLDNAYFRFALPAEGIPERIVIRKDKEVLDEIVVSKHRPTVKITSPRGNEEWDGTRKLTWSAKDLDGDPLTYLVFYSPEGARSSSKARKARWVPVAWGVQGDSYEVNMDRLPGGAKGVFKIIATDGFHTVSAMSSGNLMVKDKPPTVTLVLPDLSPPADVSDENPNQYQYRDVQEMENSLTGSFPEGPIVFEAHAFDLEDGSLTDESILWFLGKKKRFMGKGGKPTFYFESGVHLITLAAADSAGNTVEKEFSIVVGDAEE
jgi:hypothetical protein